MNQTIKKFYPEWLLAFLTGILLVPFLSKAFHMDDPLFIWTAKQILLHPFDYFDFEKNWYGFIQPMHEINQNPPLVSYYQALIGSLFGWNEWVMHAAFLLPAMAVSVGVYYLAKDFCKNSLFVSLFFIAMPGFLVSATNVMSDIPMLACYIWSIVYWKKGLKSNSWKFLALSALLASVAALTKYFAITLVPLLLVYSLLQKQGRGLTLLWLLLPVVALSLYQINSLTLYGHGLFADAASYSLYHAPCLTTEKSMEVIITPLLKGLCFLGGAMLPALFLFPLLYPSKIKLLLWILLPLICYFLWLLPKQNWDLALQESLFIVLGAHILSWTLLDLWNNRNSDSFLLAALTFGTFIFSSELNWSVNIRTMLPLIPPVTILLFRRLERKSDPTIPFLLFLCALIAGAVLTLTITYADFHQANIQKNAAEEIMQEYKHSKSKVYFFGHWGFQYYMELFGGNSIDLSHINDTWGNIVIAPLNNTGSLPMENFFKKFNSDLSLVKTWEKKISSFVHLMRPERNAGFYSHVFGKMPYSFGKKASESFLILSVDKPEKD